MATVTEALSALGVTEWVVNGEPTNAEEFGSMFRKVTGKTEDGTAILSDNATDWGVTWDEVNTKMQELTAAEPMEALREERNRKLAETDWWAVQDRTMTQDQKDYRTALRDITKDYSSLDDVKWPDVPNW
tara:strand:+ start:1604 stop:1993 length:390 start_codon:yes stop_codon:yes gene_type:complete